MSKSFNLPNGYNLIILDSVDSTNEEVKRRAVKNADEGLVVWSKTQTSGKGRNHREWVSNLGNLYISVLFRPNCNLFRAAQLSFIPVIAAHNTLEHLLGVLTELKYKWPNDLLLKKKKIAGTLLEAGYDQKSWANWVVLGFGLNLKHFPTSTIYPATSIKDELDNELEIKEVVEIYIQNLAQLYSVWQDKGFEPLRKKWLARGHMIDDVLQINFGREKISGFFRTIDEKGSLIIKTNDGSRRLSAGEVYSLPITGEF